MLACLASENWPDSLDRSMENGMTMSEYHVHSERFLAQARAELAMGDLQRASEKGWGAAAQMLKAVAEQRGWEHNRHRHLSRIASRLRSETGDRDIVRFFATASLLHENFYENELSSNDVAEGLDDVESLVDKVAPLLRTG